MAHPAKYDFGTVFDGLVDDGRDHADDKEPTWTAPEVEAEKAQAYAKGSTAGRTDALADIEQRLSQTLDSVLEQSVSTLSKLAEIEAGLVSEARQLSVAVGQAIASELLMQSHRLVIEGIVNEALGFLTQQPHVVIRVHEDLVEELRTRFAAIAETRGFTGKLVILGEPDLERADCRIEWADGGITRDGAALAGQLDQIVKRHMSPADTDPDQRDLFTTATTSEPMAQNTTEETTQ